jgi:ADP-heptose:LPS heptosyltransferase
MFSKLSKKSAPKKILVFSQSNIGDVVLSCPVIDILRENFPKAQLDVIAGPKAKSLFEGNPYLNFKLFDKRASLKETISFFFDLLKERYDCIVDLRHTMIPVFLMPRFSTSLVAGKDFNGHKKQAHLNRLHHMYAFKAKAEKKYAISNLREDEIFFEKEINPFLKGGKFVVIAPGAADGAKRWVPEGFVKVAEYVSLHAKVVFVGDANDVAIINDIQSQMKQPSLSLGGKINLRQLAFVLKKSSWALTHDSGIMHLSSYLNVPLVVLWGPTSLERYAPWSKKSMVVRRNEKCERCQNPKSTTPHQCMSLIKPEDVIETIAKFRS